jgi:hypothetical protein
MILSITALIASILALVYQVYTNREENKRWDEYFENQKKQRQKEAPIKMMSDDAEDNLYQEGEMIIEHKGDRETYITFKQNDKE